MTRPNPITPFGLLAWLEATRIELPLRKIDCRFDVAGDLATVELVQIFQQNCAQSLDVTYTFPLPANAAVYRCELSINGRVIKAVVMEQQAAAKLVEQKKAEGYRTALVQAERENLFTLDLGNAAPGDTIEVRFAYLQVLDRLDATLSLSIPFTPGMRYIAGKPLVRSNMGAGADDDTDQVPDASRISPPRILADHPDIAELYIEGRLTAEEVNLATMSSPTHPVILKAEGEHVAARLASGTDIPNRDFVLRWEEPAVDVATIRSWSCRYGDAIYALLQIRAPRVTDERPAKPQDVYFLVDRSGSMAGVKWEKCAAALNAFVTELGADDRVWITFFETSFRDFAERPMLRAEILADSSFRGIERMGTNGGTELLPALKHVNEVLMKHSNSRKARIVLITDGQVGNEAEVQGVAIANAKVPIHCFGIDNAVNDALLRNLASRTRGRCALMTPDDDIAGAVAKLARTLRQPVLTDIELSGELKTANTEAQFPELCAGEISVVAIKCGKDDNRVDIAGTLVNGDAWQSSFDLHPDDTRQAPRLAWARRRIESLIADDSSEAVNLACEHNLVCKGASFVAIDDAEKVPVAQRNVYQPAALPMLCAAVGGGVSGMVSFFESRVTNYRKASALRLPDHGESKRLERIARGLARDVGSRYKDFFERELSAIHEVTQALRAWFSGAHGLPPWIADALANIMRSWILQEPDRRIAIAESWIATQASRRDPIHLMKILETNLTGDHQSDAVKVIEQALALRKEWEMEL